MGAYVRKELFLKSKSILIISSPDIVSQEQTLWPLYRLVLNKIYDSVYVNKNKVINLEQYFYFKTC
jgi:hypothetical protein